MHMIISSWYAILPHQYLSALCAASMKTISHFSSPGLMSPSPARACGQLNKCQVHFPMNFNVTAWREGVPSLGLYWLPAYLVLHIYDISFNNINILQQERKDLLPCSGSSIPSTCCFIHSDHLLSCQLVFLPSFVSFQIADRILIMSVSLSCCECSEFSIEESRIQ